ncbi:hypothetical protein AAF712_012573 [Marasmius tenuissimus]|uniref:Uncharacterized protein n=1 Tax=Marasmius tenuissimus TaxID=585030 RepID=A0ABR2ZG33_9AGAR
MQLKVSSILTVIAAVTVPLVGATPTKRDVWSPRIISPDASTVWRTGGKYNVTWDTSNPPERITPGNEITLMNLNQEIFGSCDSCWYNEVIRPLDTFSLLDGFAEVIVPFSIPADDQYFVTLFGSSDNRSPHFRIVRDD